MHFGSILFEKFDLTKSNFLVLYLKASNDLIGSNGLFGSIRANRIMKNLKIDKNAKKYSDFKAKNARIGFDRTNLSKILKNRYNSFGEPFPHFRSESH